MRWQQGMVPTYYDGYEYGGHDPGYEADLEAFIQEASPDICGQRGSQGGQCGLVPEHDGHHYPVRVVRVEPELDPWERGRDAAEWTAQPREPEPLPRVLAPEESAPPAPDPSKLPDGTPHPNQLLADLGWRAQGGWYVRQREADREPGE